MVFYPCLAVVIACQSQGAEPAEWLFAGLLLSRMKGRIMATKVIIQHPVTGLTKNGYYGFSWTYLFFGWLVPLFRGELGVAAWHALFTLLTAGLWQFVLCFLYNKQYMTRMLEKGYVLKDSETTMLQARMALGIGPV